MKKLRFLHSFESGWRCLEGTDLGGHGWCTIDGHVSLLFPFQMVFQDT